MEIIDYAKAFSRNVASKKYDLSGNTITYWTKREENLKAQKNKENKITIHKGLTTKYYDIENNLIEFIEFNRKLNNPV